MFFCSPDLNDMERLQTLINTTASEMFASVTSSGHQYAMSHAQSHITPADALSEQFGGMSQV